MVNCEGSGQHFVSEYAYALSSVDLSYASYGAGALTLGAGVAAFDKEKQQ